ncbi:ER membrane complex subunit 3 [Rhizophlyctis rosea]|uniref:ER membrane protein complex subunit 3 n=1 Tax=Rhizophlyctis rosea TaxID=64517 RepID=A0AAD5S6A2_9FUNG|nr:ER membrane complex subunit 3 [Rhizophlyctis rosea]
MARESQQIFLDPAIRDWVLIPIMVVMVLVGVLRHHITQLLASKPKTDLKAIRESAALTRSRILRTTGVEIPPTAFAVRRSFLSAAFEKHQYLKNPAIATSQQQANPMGDPKAMEPLMDMMKNNVASIVPQTLIMSWITFFFSGFVLIKLPFPLTLRFKAMLQRGIETSDMDVTWVSSLSWYFLNLFGLKSIYTLILGEGNAAEQGVESMAGGMMPTPTAQPMQQPNEILNMFKNEKDFLDLAVHEWALRGVEERILEKYGVGVAVGGGEKGGKAE